MAVGHVEIEDEYEEAEADHAPVIHYDNDGQADTCLTCGLALSLTRTRHLGQWPHLRQRP